MILGDNLPQASSWLAVDVKRPHLGAEEIPVLRALLAGLPRTHGDAPG